MGRKGTPAFDLKMYRHFAVVTVALTGALAIFADGKRDASAAPAPPIAAAPSPSPALPIAAIRRTPAPGWGEDHGGGAAPSFNIAAGMAADWGAGIDRFDMPGMSVADVALGEDVFRQLGIAPHAFADLTEAQQRAMLAELHNRQAANAAAASRARAGGAQEGNDA